MRGHLGQIIVRLRRAYERTLAWTNLHNDLLTGIIAIGTSYHIMSVLAIAESPGIVTYRRGNLSKQPNPCLLVHESRLE